MSEKEIVKKIVEIVIDKAAIKVSPEELSKETSLNKEEFSLDSIQQLEVLVGLEKEFGVYFDDDDVGPALFDSIGNLTALVEKALVVGKEKQANK